MLLPRYLEIIFVIRNSLVFLLIASTAGYLIYLFNRKLIENPERNLTKNQILLSRIVAVIILGLICFETINIQNNYIDYYETPELESISYYDVYGNYIHGSYHHVLPEIEVISDTNDLLKLRFTYHLSNTESKIEVSDVGNVYEVFPIGDAINLVDVSIMYDSNHSITNQVVQSSYVYSRDNFISIEDRVYKDFVYTSTFYNIETVYEENAYHQRVEYYKFTTSTEDYVLEDIVHHDFSDQDQYYISDYSLIITDRNADSISFNIIDNNFDNVRYNGSYHNDSNEKILNIEQIDNDPYSIIDHIKSYTFFENKMVVKDEYIYQDNNESFIYNDNTSFTEYVFLNEYSSYIMSSDHLNTPFDEELNALVYNNSDYSYVLNGRLLYKVSNVSFGTVTELYETKDEATKDEISVSRELEYYSVLSLDNVNFIDLSHTTFYESYNTNLYFNPIIKRVIQEYN